jgi:hypothetical protein
MIDKGIFISYRRDDTQNAAGRLYDQLVKSLPQDSVFMDVDKIEPGLDFKDVLDAKLKETSVILVLIGRQWLSAHNTSGKRRIDNPEDFVRQEIEAGLIKNIRVIPVLVDGAEMPSSDDLPDALKMLARRQNVELRHRSFASDVDELAIRLRAAFGIATQASIDRLPGGKAAAASPQSDQTFDEGAFYALGRDTRLVTNWDSYQTRMAKYVPVEVIAAYLALDRILIPDAQSFIEKARSLQSITVSSIASHAKPWSLSDPSTAIVVHNSLPLIILFAGCAFTPLYIRQLATVEGIAASARKQHAFISTLAFFFWAYAIQGSAFTVGYLQGAYAGSLASSLLIIFTLASGLFGPAPVRPGYGGR